MTPDYFRFAADNARREFQGWTQLSVGCHWTRDGYTISTTTGGGRSGYVLVHNYEEIAFAPTFKEAAKIADALELRCEICGESAGEGGALCPACAANG